MSSVAPEPRRLQGYLQENIRLFRERVVGVPHRYWNKAMSPLAEWTVYVTHIFPPDSGSLRARVVVEAHQTARDSTARGVTIGPFVYVTPLLVELEKRSKASRPPAYWDKRPPTTRKAEEQLRVDELPAVWFLSKYLQGEVQLTDDVLPPRSKADPDFRSSFSDEQIQQALRSKRQRNKRARPDGAAPPSARRQPPSARLLRSCAVCAEPVLVAPHGARGKIGVVGQSTGVACEPCAQVLCGTCLFERAAQYTRRPELHHDGLAYCTHAAGTCPHGAAPSLSTLGDALICADEQRLRGEGRGFLTADGEPDATGLLRELTTAHERQRLQRLWRGCFATTAIIECPAPTCGGLWLESLRALRTRPVVECPFCRRAVCVRCGDMCEAGGGAHACHVRRPALRGAEAGPADAPFATAYAVESMVHAVHATLRRVCSRPQCGAEVFLAFRAADATCWRCGAEGASAADEIERVAALLVDRLRAPIGASIVTELRRALHAADAFRHFACAEELCDRMEALLSDGAFGATNA